MTRDELALALERANLLRSADAAHGIRAGWEIETELTITGTNLSVSLATDFSIRADHLRTVARSPHITQEVDSMEEFVRNLRHEAGTSCRLVFVTGIEEEDYDYRIFFSESGEVLGCMGGLNLLRLPAKRRAELCPEIEEIRAEATKKLDLEFGRGWSSEG